MGQAQRQRQRFKTIGREWTTFREVPITDEIRRSAPHMKNIYKMWENSRFRVDAFQVDTPLGGVIQLVIKRHYDLEKIDWNDVQRIRYELFGADCLGLELYPTGASPGMSVRMLWIMPQGYDLPIGMDKPGAWGVHA